MMTIIKNLSWSCYARRKRRHRLVTNEGEVQSREDRAQTHADAFPQSCRKVQPCVNLTVVFFVLVFKGYHEACRKSHLGTKLDLLKVVTFGGRPKNSTGNEDKSILFCLGVVDGITWMSSQRFLGILQYIVC